MYRNKYKEGQTHTISELLEIIHALRDPEYGCAWDSAQTHESMKKCLIDESEEVLQAIDKGDDQNLCEELGDVFLQILINAEIASERGAFDFDDVIQMLTDKLIRRHPHVFGDEPRPTNPTEGLGLWKKIKRTEKYHFYGHQKVADIKATSVDYPGIENPLDLYDALSDIWCSYSCAPRMRDNWSPENKTCGQCSITAFLAQDIFGGEVYGTLTEGGNIHCYNVVNGIAFDLTSEQFGEKAKDLKYESNPIQERESAGHFGKEEKRQRYEYLREQLRKKLI